MDYSEAESHFYRQQDHMSTQHSLLLLYEQLGTLVKSAQYIVLQTRQAPLDVKQCLHQALQVMEEIQRQHLQAPVPPEQAEQLLACYRQLQGRFEQSVYAPEDFNALVPEVRQLASHYRQQQGIKKRRSDYRPPLNVNRSVT